MYGNDKYVDPAYESYQYGGLEYDPHTAEAPAEYDYEQYSQMDKTVRDFLLYFAECVNERMLFELQSLYETHFPKTMEDYYGKNAWPSEEMVVRVVGQDPVFLTLYKELYYRHIYEITDKPGPSLEIRVRSFYNYCDLFTYILGAEHPVPLELPDQWLWEIIDEFVYQFQSFARYQASKAIGPEEIAFLQSDKSVWNVINVLNVLHSMIEKSNIKRQLEVYASGGDPNSVAGEFGRHSLYKMLGYFSLVGLLRLHSLLGDYYQAIKVLKNIELHKKSQYAHVPACQISTSYYVGFSYMMMRRYSDAIRTFSSSLLYIQRTKQMYQSTSYQHDQIKKQTDQMYHLLAICLVLHPQYIDESLQHALRDKNFLETMNKMQRGELEEFQQCFLYACPKFVPATPPLSDSDTDLVEETIKHQKDVFMDEVRQQKNLPTIRSYLKLYTTLPLSKLATFMSQGQRDSNEWDLNKEMQDLIINLLCFKHKMKNVVWTKGTSGLDGKFQSGSELDFYIDRDMIHIADTKVSHRYGDFFIRKILKFEELNRKLHSLRV